MLDVGCSTVPVFGMWNQGCALVNPPALLQKQKGYRDLNDG